MNNQQQLNKQEKIKLLKRIIRDYSIASEDILLILEGKKERIGHLDRLKLIQRRIESYPWFTVRKLVPVEDIAKILSNDFLARLRFPSLKRNYEFLKERLQGHISITG